MRPLRPLRAGLLGTARRRGALLQEEGREFHIYTPGDVRWPTRAAVSAAPAPRCVPPGAIQDKDELVKDKNRKAALVPCKSTCPAEIDVPRYVRFIKDGDYPAAVAVIREKVPFPGSSATSAIIPARAELPEGRGQRAHLHQGTQALRGRA